MAWISFGALPCRKKKKLMAAHVSMLLKSRASLTCFRNCFLPGRAKDLSAPQYITRCVLVNSRRRLGDAYFLHLQGPWSPKYSCFLSVLVAKKNNVDTKQWRFKGVDEQWRSLAKSFLTGCIWSSDLSREGACVEAFLFDNRGQYPTFTAVKVLKLYDNFRVQMRFLTVALLTV